MNLFVKISLDKWLNEPFHPPDYYDEIFSRLVFFSSLGDTFYFVFESVQFDLFLIHLNLSWTAVHYEKIFHALFPIIVTIILRAPP